MESVSIGIEISRDFRRFSVSYMKLIFPHQMWKMVICFGLGVYTGLYLSQNYEIPKVDDPSMILARLKELAEEYKKK